MSTSPGFTARDLAVSSRYQVVRRLGSGSMGTVYLARDTTANRLVALKVLRARHLDPHGLDRLQEEFRAITRVEHPQIARAYDFGYTESGHFPFYTREYVEGEPVPAGPPGGRPPSRCLSPMLDLLDALEYVHRHGILHLDIHAGNLIVSRDEARGSVVIDFGLIEPLRPSRLSTLSDAWSVLPPELIEGGKLTARADVYSAGRLLLYLITGRAGEEARLPQEIPGWGTRLTLDLERILQKALEPTPQRRFSSAAEFREALAVAVGASERRRVQGEPQHVLVGREGEVAEVEGALRELRSGKSSFFWFVGRPGSGKSRLVSEIRLNAQLRGHATLEARFRGDEEAGSSLSRLLGAVKGGRDTRSWIQLLSPRHGGTPAERAQRAAEVYFAESGRPLVLILEDFDEAEGESRILGEALLEEGMRRRAAGTTGRGMVLVITSRRLPRFRPAGDAVRRLRPLGPADAKRLFLELVKPLATPSTVAARAVARARGSPLALRQLARALCLEWAQLGAIPKSAEIPALGPRPATAVRPDLLDLSEASRATLETLAIIGRGATRREIVRASGRSGDAVARSMRRLVELELVEGRRYGRAQLYRLGPGVSASELITGVSEAAIRQVHERLVEGIETERPLSARQAENLARHLLVMRRRAAALREALAASKALREAGSFENAIRLLRDLAREEADPVRRLRIAEEISAIAEETGDHEQGIDVLEPIHAAASPGTRHRSSVALSGEVMTRIRRRLGMHYHRAGKAGPALAMFEEARRHADPERDVEHLIFVDTELAELHLFQGNYDEAEKACRRGLDRLKHSRTSQSARRMQVPLRASLGHIELRRLCLEQARAELEEALRLGRRHGTVAERAGILHNLAIAENQLNDFSSSRKHFREAERLWLRSGERRNVIKVATNLAVIAAKLGDVDQAALQIERASQLVRRYPDTRIEFFVVYARGIVALVTGRPEEAVKALEDALEMGAKLGDRHLVSFGGVYLAEAHLLAGQYGAATRRLRRSAAEAPEDAPALLTRMIHSRQYLLHALLGQSGRALRAFKELQQVPRTNVTLLEAYNDAFVGVGQLVSGEPASATLEDALRVFRSVRVVFGARSCQLALLADAMSRREEARVRDILGDLGDCYSASHPFLAVADALARAEVRFELGHRETAGTWLARASGAIVGFRFLELDWRVELLRARMAIGDRDLREARRNLHRCVHARDLLLHEVPKSARKAFLAHPRFAALRATEERLSRAPRVEVSTASLARLSRYEGLVGQTSPMLRVFHTIERLHDQEPVVLISGETGTGKELVARAIHRRSPRHEGPFLPLHCAALPEELLEAELCGYERGAFSGADADRPGLLEELRNGTLFLDHIEELSPGSQTKLLRIVDSQAVRRLGGVEPRPVDVRFLVASSVDLREAAERGTFRADLMYRIAGLEIRLPPLRERRGDIPALARHFLELHSGRLDRAIPAVEEGIWATLERYPWPGNVRELEATLLRALVVLGPGETLGNRAIEAALSPSGARGTFGGRRLLARDIESWRRELEREYLTELYREVSGDPRRMMERLGIGKTKLYAWFRRLGLDVREMRRELS